VVAEGVENHETLLTLRQLKCDMAQGYYLSPPLSSAALATWLRDYQPRIAR
jgi:EAL domain-containing protein (putative c-di-GMP-specific phosphodiesterase class I)